MTNCDWDRHPTNRGRWATGHRGRATGRIEYSEMASECIAFENASYDNERRNWALLINCAAC